MYKPPQFSYPGMSHIRNKSTEGGTLTFRNYCTCGGWSPARHRKLNWSFGLLQNTWHQQYGVKAIYTLLSLGHLLYGRFKTTVSFSNSMVEYSNSLTQDGLSSQSLPREAVRLSSSPEMSSGMCCTMRRNFWAGIDGLESAICHCPFLVLRARLRTADCPRLKKRLAFSTHSARSNMTAFKKVN